jgi:hypothetical protein
MRRTHHHAFKHSLPTDQSFFAAFQRGKKLHGHKETHEITQRLHDA